MCINVFSIFGQIEAIGRAWEGLFVTKKRYSLNFHVGENSTMREQQCEHMINAGSVKNCSSN
jgi:hypothetical protein